MLVSPKWQTMWLESQHCSKSIVNLPFPSQQTQKVLEDLRTNCCSPNKAVQLEALKCWGFWINNQNFDDWKLNTVCFTAVRPLITKKLQPLHKDVDICKMKLGLMWALLVKVQNIMHLEGPQYILEVFLQSCLTWLSSTSGVNHENEISDLIFQLLLAIFKKDETLDGHCKEMFPQISADIFHVKRVFHRFVDKFLNIFVHWRKVQEKKVTLKLWKHFLEQCELSCEHIPIPVWHKIFKLACQICSEKSEPIKERLAFLHSCATTLKSALSSSKFIDFGNLLTTPCEALLKKLVELCSMELKEFFDTEMFFHSKEICEVLSNRSVTISGFSLCISVLDILEEFWLRSLFWGVWCGLVSCYKVQLLGIDKNQFTKIQMIFYRKLRGIAINFELDRKKLHKDCIKEVEKYIDILNISCLCASRSGSEIEKNIFKDSSCRGDELTVVGQNFPQLQSVPISSYSKEVLKVAPTRFCGTFSEVANYKKSNFTPRRTVIVEVGFIKNLLKSIGINSAKPFFNCLFNFRFITLKATQRNSLNLILGPSSPSLCITDAVNGEKEKIVSLSCLKAKPPSPVPECTPVKTKTAVTCARNQKTESDEEVISVRRTRSKKRAEEEEEKKKKEMECIRTRKRKSFEVLVHEILRKNKDRKTEKNCKRKKCPELLKSKRNKKKIKKLEKENKVEIKENVKKTVEVSNRKLRNSRKEDPKTQNREKKFFKADGKLENYFKVITRKSVLEGKKEEKKSQNKKKAKENTRSSSCCSLTKEDGKRKAETSWRQTSLKAMMKRKPEKVKQGLRTRSKSADDTNEIQKIKKDNRKSPGSPLAKLSPFKEVFHDHEYAKLEPEYFDKGFLGEQKAVGTKKRKKSEKGKPPQVKEVETNAKPEIIQARKLEKDKSSETWEENCGVSESLTLEYIPFEESIYEVDVAPEEQNHQEQIEETGCCEPEIVSDFSMKESELEKMTDQPITNDVNPEESKVLTVELQSSRRGKKRVKMLDSLKPSKKIKLEEEVLQEEKLPLEVTEKENFEEKPEFLSPTKKEKGGITVSKFEGSPKTMNGMISSRALRMIALLPESTKGSQMQWESSHRAEILKSKKAPNVDKNSRASKMLALLSENVIGIEELDDVKMEELNSSRELTKTPVSSLKSPKSVKKRRSIRFDDAKNETVLYQTDTPPSQILEEKEKCRRIRPTEIILNLP